jgi:hypothetical protein
MFDLYPRVSLNCDFPEHHFKKGDVASLIDYVPHPGNREEARVLEMFSATGESIAVVIVPISAIYPLRNDEILTVLPLVEVS